MCKTKKRWHLISDAVDCYDDVWRWGIALQDGDALDPHCGGEWSKDEDWVIGLRNEECEPNDEQIEIMRHIVESHNILLSLK